MPEKTYPTPSKKAGKIHGINLEPSPAYAKQSNSAAERLIQERWTRARVMLFACNLPNNFGMASDLVLIKVFIPQTKSILRVRMDNFRIQDKSGLPGIEILLDVIAKQLAKEQEEANAIQQEAHLLNRFLSIYTLLPQCLVTKEKFDPNAPISFEEACQYPG